LWFQGNYEVGFAVSTSFICQNPEVILITENTVGLFSATVWKTSSSKGRGKKMGFVTDVTFLISTQSPYVYCSFTWQVLRDYLMAVRFFNYVRVKKAVSKNCVQGTKKLRYRFSAFGVGLKTVNSPTHLPLKPSSIDISGADQAKQWWWSMCRERSDITLAMPYKHTLCNIDHTMTLKRTTDTCRFAHKNTAKSQNDMPITI